jgi:hypothetical protein
MYTTIYNMRQESRKNCIIHGGNPQETKLKFFKF